MVLSDGLEKSQQTFIAPSYTMNEPDKAIALSTAPVSIINYAIRSNLLSIIYDNPLELLSMLHLHTCHHCNNIIIDPQSVFQIHTLPYSIDECLEAANSGCIWYIILLGFVRRSGKPAQNLDLDQFFFEIEYRDRWLAGSCLWDILSLVVKTGTKYYSWPCLHFHVVTEPDDPAAASITSRPVNRYVSSDAAFEQAEKWLAECHSKHPRCQASISRFLPNRVLDVDVPGRPSIIRLVSTNTVLPPERKYAALSYCWGGPQPITTTTSTISAHQSQIFVESLPQTLRDAISVTRRMGLRHLWIDSLCIVQDSPIDVSREISLMPEYYSHAFFTICAASSPSCTSGFLYPRRSIPYLSGPFEIRYRCPDDRLGKIKLVQYTPFSIEEEVINTRGWTLQESLLSTRLLTFGSRNLRWSCRTAQYSDGGPHDAHYDSGLRKQIEVLTYLGDDSFQERYKLLVMGWRDVVENYSRRQIRVPSDKLAALSGIARMVHEVLGTKREGLNGYLKCEYLAGIWDVDITRGLFWNTDTYYRYSAGSITESNHGQGSLIEGLNVEGSRNKLRTEERARPLRAKEYRAPSWSWACIDGGIGHVAWSSMGLKSTYMEWEPRSQVACVDIEPTMKDAPYGSLKSAALSLIARVIDAVDLEDEQRSNFVLIPDTSEDKELVESAMKVRHCKLLLLADVDVTKVDSGWRSRGLVIVETFLGSGEYKRIGIFESKMGLEEVEPASKRGRINPWFGDSTIWDVHLV